MRLPATASVRTWVNSRLLLLIAVAACSSRREQPAPGPAPEAVTRAPAPIAVLFERTLPGGEDRAPLFGPGGSIAVGPRQWTRDGRYVGRHVWGTRGQVRPIGVIGSVDRPLIVSIGWGGLDDEITAPAKPNEPDHAWLLVAEPTAAKPVHVAPTAHDFLDGGFTLSPHGAALVASEGADMVVRALPSGAIITRAPHGAAKTDDAPVACWVDDARVAWTGNDGTAPVLRTLTITTGAVAITRIAAAAPLHCDPAGGAAAMEAPEGTITLLDLVTGATLATARLAPTNIAATTATSPTSTAEAKPATGRDVPSDDDEPTDEVTPPSIAVGQHGARIAVAFHDVLTVYDRDGGKLAPLYTHALVAGAPVRMAFSPEGERLAVATTALTVLGPPTEVHPGFAPHIAFELPRGFTSMPTHSKAQDAWRWAQLGGPSGMAPQSALLVNAVDQEKLWADVTAIAIARDEFTNPPAPDATDQQIAAFAKATMPQLFEQWENATIGPERDDEFTLRVGRTKGMPWFETREVWRDGCEPYDGYTRVVVDRDAVFVIRALVPPAGSIKGWLEKFFDLPFGMRVQTARRHGPETGPC